MKRIITALGNPILNNELKRYEKYDVIFNDLIYQEAVIDVLNENEVDILVVSALLQGEWDFIDFIKRIRKINKMVRVIVITNEITLELKDGMFSNGIFDIFCDNEIEAADIIESIDREEPITKKIAKVKEKREEVIGVEETKSVYVTKIQKQEIIAISGTNGSGKSTVTYKLSKYLSTKSDSKILVVDLDTLNGNIDELFSINKIPQNVEILLDEDKKCGINYAVELINKNRFDSNVFEELVIKSGKIDVLTGNTSLHFCQNVLCEKYYDKILEVAKEKYDFILIDTSSNVFLDSTRWAVKKANRVFFILENNNLCLKKMNQLLNIFLNVWKVWKGKIQIIINKKLNEGIERDFIQNIVGNIDVISEIKFGEVNNEPYEKILQYINYIPKVNLIDKFKENFQNTWNKKIMYRLGKGEVNVDVNQSISY